MAAATPKKPFAIGDDSVRPVTDLIPTENLWESLSYLADEVKDAIALGERTPDYPELCRKKHHYVFVYGTLKKGYRNHSVMGKNPKLVGIGYTAYDAFFLVKNSYGKYPVAFYDARPEVKARVYGEVYQVEADDIRALDCLESNGTSFRRASIFVDVTQKDALPQRIKAWCYLGNREYWANNQEVLTRGRMILPSNDKKYYIFTLSDEDS